MKKQSKKPMQKGKLAPKTRLVLSSTPFSYLSCLSFLVSVLLIYPANAETSTEHLDPTDILLAHSDNPVEKPNSPGPVPMLNDLTNLHLQPFVFQSFVPKRQTVEQNHASPTIVNFTSKLGQELPQRNQAVSPDSNDLNNAEYGLWQAEVAAPLSKENNESKEKLSQMIQLMRSIEFNQSRTTTKSPKEDRPEEYVEPEEQPEPNGILKDIKEITNEQTEQSREEERTEPKIQVSLPYEPLSEQTLQMLESLVQHPEQSEDPLELAEILFLSDHLQQASIFYKEALNRRGADEEGSDADRAWILLQLGNCLRGSEPQTARQIYTQLISEYPDSPWTDYAKTQEKLLDWFIKDQPKTLLNESRLQDFRPNREKGVSQD